MTRHPGAHKVYSAATACFGKFNVLRRVILMKILKASWWQGATVCVSIMASFPLLVAEAALPRFPNASADRIAFVAGGNLWSVPRLGGIAVKLTDDPGQVMVPRFSPDGRSIAFTWRRAGIEDVYVMRASGGAPKRLTFGPSRGSYDNLVTSWTPDSKRIIFLSQRRARFLDQFAAYSISVEGGLAESLPFDYCGLLSFSPDGGSVAFDPTYRNLGGDKWKRYEGGQAPDIFTYAFKTKELTRITNWKGIDTAPMWWRNRIYFLSDRGAGRRANLWVYDLDTKETRQVTRYADLDVDMPSLGADAITFQQGGRLIAIDLPQEKQRVVRVTLQVDDRVKAHSVDAAHFLRTADIAGEPDYAMAPDSRSAVVAARGDLFAASASAARNLTQTPSADEDHPAISPDGRLVAYITDRPGTQQVAVKAIAGGHERILSHLESSSLYTPRWSPDGRMLVVADANHRLWLLNSDGGPGTKIAADPYAEIHDARFSPDSAWLAYSTVGVNQLRAIHLHQIATGEDHIVSSDMNSDREPVFSSDGSYLFFVSKRHELPIVADRDQETDIATLKSDGIYEVRLAADDAGATPKPGGPISIDLSGLMSRAASLPITAGNIAQLEPRGGRLFYRMAAPSLIQGRLPGESSGLYVFDLRTRRNQLIVADIDGYELSADGVGAMIDRDGRIDWIDAADGADRHVSALKDTQITVNPRAEWREMFEHAWRLDRDLFWNSALNGNDWRAVHDAYLKLVPLISSHEDFMYLLGELQGELSNSHMFIGRGDEGDYRLPAKTALLGADYEIDAASGRYRFKQIYVGDGTRSRFVSPLGAIQPAITAGTFLMAINGRDLIAPDDPFSALVGSAGDVTLTLAESPGGPPRNVIVKPIGSEIALRQFDWIEHNRRTVDRQSGGRIGYLFLSDFAEEGSEDFVRQFYPQIDRQGLIIDDRWNRGGFTSQWVLSILRRKLAGQFVNREGASTTLPGSVPPAAMTVLTNKFSSSDGDQFPYYFREYGLGRIIGSRTWGGVRGIKGPWTLMDGTYITVPKDSLYSTEGRWIIENRGTEPDIEVPDSPLAQTEEIDAQLAAGLQLVTRELVEKPPAVIPTPPLVPSYPAISNVPPASFHDRNTHH